MPLFEKGPLGLSIEQELLQGQLNSEQIEGARATTDGLFTAKDAFHEQASRISTDERLSDAGRAINSARIELLDNKKLITQLCSLERRTGGVGKDASDQRQT